MFSTPQPPTDADPANQLRVWVLKEWNPDDEYSLFKLLDRVQVRPELEAEIERHLKGLDAEGGRQLLHIQSDEELLSMGVPAGLVSRIAGAITKKIEGFLKVHELRSKSGRSMVKAFNKEKHMLLAFPRDGPSGHGILLPTARIKAATKIHAEIFTIDGVEIRPSPGYIRNRAKRAMEAQAILWDTLSLILQTRYRTVAPTPDWVESTLDTWGD